MGQCITIEIGTGNKDATESQLARHGDNHIKHKKKHKHQKKELNENNAESSDEETSDEDVVNQNKIADKDGANKDFGQFQSPINIITCGASENKCKVMNEDDMKTNPLKFNYPDLVRGCTIINTGHTVQVNIPDHSKCSMFINNKQYQLKQFHFHTPSEHLIDNVQYEMEMHLVHINEEGEIAVLGFIFTTKQNYFKPTLKLTKSRQHLIEKTKSIIMNADNNNEDDELQVQNDENEEEVNENDKEKEQGDDRRQSSVKKLEENDFLAQFWDQLPLKKTTEEIRLTCGISFDHLFEASSKTFKKSVESNEISLDMELFEYPGSLTTPPFTEGVHWFVSRTTHFINVQQLNKLSSCWGHHSNARECQHICNREVQIRNQSTLQAYFFN